MIIKMFNMLCASLKQTNWDSAKALAFSERTTSTHLLFGIRAPWKEEYQRCGREDRHEPYACCNRTTAVRLWEKSKFLKNKTKQMLVSCWSKPRKHRFCWSWSTLFVLNIWDVFWRRTYMLRWQVDTGLLLILGDNRLDKQFSADHELVLYFICVWVLGILYPHGSGK